MTLVMEKYPILILAVVTAMAGIADAQVPGQWGPISPQDYGIMKTWVNNSNLSSYFNKPSYVLYVDSGFQRVGFAGTDYVLRVAIQFGKKKNFCIITGFKNPKGTFQVKSGKCYDCPKK